MLTRQLQNALRQAPRHVSVLSESSRGFHRSAPRLEHYLNVSPEKFEERVTKGGDKIVLVDFYADWCGPCHTISPLLKKVTSDTSLSGGKELDLVTVNTDENQELAMKYSISSLPTVMAFKNGQPISHFIGAIPLPRIQKFVSQL